MIEAERVVILSGDLSRRIDASVGAVDRAPRSKRKNDAIPTTQEAVGEKIPVHIIP